MKTKTKLKSLKPIDIDAHFRYRCPDTNCGFDHWLSLKECQTKGFRIVCDCGNVFKPRRIESLNIEYVKAKPVETNQQESAKALPPPKKTIPVDTQNKCARLLIGYGFTKEESLDLVDKGFQKTALTDAKLLIKYIVQNLGELNEQG